MCANGECLPHFSTAHDIYYFTEFINTVPVIYGRRVQQKRLTVCWHWYHVDKIIDFLWKLVVSVLLWNETIAFFDQTATPSQHLSTVDCWQRKRIVAVVFRLVVGAPRAEALTVESRSPEATKRRYGTYELRGNNCCWQPVEGRLAVCWVGFTALQNGGTASASSSNETVYESSCWQLQQQKCENLTLRGCLTELQKYRGHGARTVIVKGLKGTWHPN